jgi:hypothetical protein
MTRFVPLALAAVLLVPLAARAAQPITPGALPSVRKQIYATARQEGVLTGVQRPSLRLKSSPPGNLINATLYGLGRSGNGTPGVRIPLEQATFHRLLSTHGEEAVPDRQPGGQIWRRSIPLPIAHP